MRHSERHRTHRTGWLRAAVLGANDGIVSTASLVLGVAAAGADTQGILVAGVAGLVAGAMSMAAGEYVSVSSQADTERADLARESKELAANPAQEHAELMAIYAKRGLDETLASSVATQLMQHGALAAHARDELGISDTLAAKPVQAALASAGTFAVGAALPLLMVLLLPVTATHVGSRRQLSLLSCAVGPSGGTRRRFTRDCVCNARHVLGRIGNGIDRWSWSPFWRGRLKSMAPKTSTPNLRSTGRICGMHRPIEAMT